MIPIIRRRLFQYLAVLIVGGSLLLSTGACPVDRDTVLAETVRAGLQATLDSFIDALSEYLAGN